MAKSYHDEISTSWIMDLIIKTFSHYEMCCTLHSSFHEACSGMWEGKKKKVLHKFVTSTLEIQCTHHIRRKIKL